MNTPRKPFRKPAGRLTDRQERFAQNYVVSLNASDAARKAGYTSNSPAQAGVKALRNAHVIARVEALQAERVKRVQVDADWVLRRLQVELEADAADLYDTDGALKPVRDWPEVWRKGMVTHIQTTILYGGAERGKPKPIGEVKDVTFADRVKRIELLGRHISVQAFRERVAVGTDSPLRALFEQIQGQSIRPAAEIQAIEHHSEPETEGDA